MKPWAILISTLLVGLAIGVGGTILLPTAIEPYLVSALRAPRYTRVLPSSFKRKRAWPYAAGF